MQGLGLGRVTILIHVLSGYYKWDYNCRTLSRNIKASPDIEMHVQTQLCTEVSAVHVPRPCGFRATPHNLIQAGFNARSVGDPGGSGYTLARHLCETKRWNCGNMLNPSVLDPKIFNQQSLRPVFSSAEFPSVLASTFRALKLSQQTFRRYQHPSTAVRKPTHQQQNPSP